MSHSRVSFGFREFCNFIYKNALSMNSEKNHYCHKPGCSELALGNLPFTFPLRMSLSMNVPQCLAGPGRTAGSLQDSVLQKREIPPACNLHVPTGCSQICIGQKVNTVPEGRTKLRSEVYLQGALTAECSGTLGSCIYNRQVQRIHTCSWSDSLI